MADIKKILEQMTIDETMLRFWNNYNIKMMKEGFL